MDLRRVANPIAGNYYLRMRANPATASCNVRAYQVASFQTPGPPQAEVFWSITTDVDQDGQFYQPLSGMDNHPVSALHTHEYRKESPRSFTSIISLIMRIGITHSPSSTCMHGEKDRRKRSGNLRFQWHVHAPTSSTSRPSDADLMRNCTTSSSFVTAKVSISSEQE
ncbi:hypothetical protein PENTCL1PPCAC_16590 [Pristionchus entomophagus]|uniref:Uncharacterized protein n=1 Tax=Pristionchus entomophagus TaxID=358040 RepID=A0AAV5TJC0_9BILA|nr:hypothetical protein PENTCL1PPCAC_16590 [Pristionchus entomophagus]